MASYSELMADKQRLLAKGENPGSNRMEGINQRLEKTPEFQLIRTISNEVIGLDRQIEELTPYLSLTDEEKQAFLNKAIEQITPYYDRKMSEYEASIKEGKVRTAENILTEIRTVEEETKVELESYDLRTAQTEEEFLNRIADVTSTKEESLDVKREDYRQRLENMKLDQIQRGTLTSGIGAKKRAEQERAKQMEESIIERQAQADVTGAETSKQYTLESVALARKAAEEQRIRKIGTPSEVASTTAQALQTTGLTDISQLQSPEELARQRTERGIQPLYDQTALPELQAQKQKAGISTQQELQADELARREQEYGLQVKKIEAERAKKAKTLQTYGVYV